MQTLKGLGSLDRFRFIIDDNTEGTVIPDNAFNLNNMNTDIKTTFFNKCCEIRITSSKITSIGSKAFSGI